MWLTFFSHYTGFLIALMIIGLSGFLLLRLLKVRLEVPSLSYSALFIYLITGIITWVTGISIVLTKGRTIFIFIIPLIGLYHFLFRKVRPSESLSLLSNLSKEFILHRLLKLALLTLSIYAIFFFRIYDYHLHKWKVIHGDYSYYAKVAWHMGQYGIESALYYPPGISPYTPLFPYHYIELWLTYFFYAIGVAPTSYLSLLLVVYPLLLLGVVTAVASLLELNGSSRPLIKGLLLSSIIGIYMPIYKYVNFFRYIDTFFVSPWNYFKISIPFLFLSSYLVIGHIPSIKKYRYLLLLLLPFSYTTIFPAWCIAFAAGVVMYLWFKKTYDIFYKILFCFVICAVSILLFYTLTASKVIGNAQNAIYGGFFHLSGLRRSFNIVAGSILQLGLLYTPWFLLLLFLWKKSSPREHIKTLLAQENSIYLILSALSSVLAWSILQKQVDAVQFITNFGIPSIALLIIVLFIRLEANTKPQIVKSTLLLLIPSFLVSIFNSCAFSFEYPYHIVAKINKYNKISACYFPVKGSDSFFSLNELFCFPCNHPNVYYPDFYSINIYPIDISTLSAEDPQYEDKKRLIENRAFEQYLRTLKEAGKYTGIEDAQLSLIQKYNIELILMPSSVYLPPHLQKLVKDSLVEGNYKYMILKK